MFQLISASAVVCLIKFTKLYEIYDVCISHMLYLLRQVCQLYRINLSYNVYIVDTNVLASCEQLSKQWLNDSSDHMDLRYTYRYPIFRSLNFYMYTYHVIAYKKMFLRTEFLAPTWYKGAFKYVYLCKGKTWER